MKRIFLILIIVLINNICVISQTNKFGRIADEQWEINKCAFDSTANALILFDIGEIAVTGKTGVKNIDPDCPLTINDFAIEYTRHVRIKVLKKDDSLKFSITLRFFDGKSDFLKSFKGVSQWKEKGEVSKNKYAQKDLKKVSNVNGGYTMTLDLSKEKEGNIIDINYTIGSNIFTELPLWRFSNDFPTVYSEISFSVPDFFIINKCCSILNELTTESQTQPNRCDVGYDIQDGWFIKTYSFNDVREKYLLRNVLSSQKTNNTYNIKFEIKDINFKSVSFKQNTWRVYKK